MPLTKIPPDGRVFIYGTGSAGRSLWMWLLKCRPDVRVIGFIDSFGSGELWTKRIFRYEGFKLGIQADQYELVLVASAAAGEISQALKKDNITHEIIPVPSYLMANLIPEPFSYRIQAVTCAFKRLFYTRRLHLFFGEHGGKFIGNNKYYYLYLKQNTDLPVYWVTDDETLQRQLQRAGIDVLNFNAPGFRRTLNRARYFYFDNMTWQRKYPWLRHFPAKIIHMSHGVGLKMTEKMLIPADFIARLSVGEKLNLEEKIFKNHLLVSTSQFYAEKVSAPAYGTPLADISLCGYPKNDLFYRDVEGAEIFTDRDITAKIAARRDKCKLIVYAPTFRDMDVNHADIIDSNEFDSFLTQNNLLLVIKGHTSIAGLSGGEGKKYTSILFYRNDRDGYPLLKEADLLITDYSSIYMDFLHTGKPVVYFTYDYEQYVVGHREIQFDYEQMTPGPKARSYPQLEKWLRHFLIEGQDDYEPRRREILTLAFQHQDGDACRRLFTEIQKKQ